MLSLIFSTSLVIVSDGVISVNSGFESQGNLDDLTNKKLNNTPNVSVNQKVVSNNEKHKDKNYKTVFYWIMAILVVLYLLNTLK